MGRLLGETWGALRGLTDTAHERQQTVFPRMARGYVRGISLRSTRKRFARPCFNAQNKVHFLHLSVTKLVMSMRWSSTVWGLVTRDRTVGP